MRKPYRTCKDCGTLIGTAVKGEQCKPCREDGE